MTTIFAINLTLLPDAWQLWAKLILIALAGGVGAFLVGQFMLTFRKAFVVALGAAVCSGIATYLLFLPEMPHLPPKTAPKAPAVKPAPSQTPPSSPPRRATSPPSSTTTPAPKPSKKPTESAPPTPPKPPSSTKKPTPERKE